ncbi:CoA ester lyase [Nocardiopsis sp. MG754419]|uniref:HpcH/HpaI aldolase/citrate lyase family protein n=1 Tax=Nocardiopsis sp. MG754419 TaxID=2259865 RepID=UPI001BAE51D1|nr:CoA ester lyase [Nocardiopsis sp. MG754419]MBR8740586.1 CoA ester lyase [Nocardiopsis sp. MG754419]
MPGNAPPLLGVGPALLFCPADRPDRIRKAAGVADAVIVDLEDAVAPAGKEAARAHVVDALRDLGTNRIVVRVNAVSTPWHEDDLRSLADRPDTVVMLPMAASPEEVEALAPHPVIALCETAAGVLAAPAIAGADNCVGLMWGGEDLAADLGSRRRPGRGPGRAPVADHARWTVLLAARARGRRAIDTVYTDLADVEGLEHDAAEAAESGFDAKACVHPRQVPAVRAAFLATPDEVAWARRVLTAAEAEGGAFGFEGAMVDAPVLARARRILSVSG